MGRKVETGGQPVHALEEQMATRRSSPCGEGRRSFHLAVDMLAVDMNYEGTLFPEGTFTNKKKANMAESILADIHAGDPLLEAIMNIEPGEEAVVELEATIEDDDDNEAEFDDLYGDVAEARIEETRVVLAQSDFVPPETPGLEFFDIARRVDDSVLAELYDDTDDPFEENAAVMDALRKQGNTLVNKAFNDEFREQRASKRAKT